MCPIGIQVLFGTATTIPACPFNGPAASGGAPAVVGSVPVWSCHALLAPLLESFRAATTVLTADHGDCWGEDGLWEHGISHRRTLEVPLLMRVRGAVLA